jgi:hypothetical protein
MMAKEDAARARGQRSGKEPIEREELVRHGCYLLCADLFSVRFLVYATELFEPFG